MKSVMDSQYELSREIELDDLARGEVELEVRARPAERAALATRFALVSLERLGARVRARRLSGGVYGLRGRLSADVTQSCVITLAPFAASIDEGFSLTWSSGSGWVDEGETLVEVEGMRPTAWDGTAIDVGEAVAQQLALALDPYPRAPDAKTTEPAEDEAPEEEGRRPFAALAELRRRLD